uniref:Nucleoprotein n=1 Tax=Chestnut teal chaphamaparvovirus TaxID=2759402 RepID=A0A7D6X610_9VIRU|nr:nucleoprotein [Chestnut teal chaphamaparvovirus]
MQKDHLETECGFLNLHMTCLMVNLFLDALAKAANAAIAESVGVGRLVLAAQQLKECREKTNPYKESWLPGMPAQNIQWGADPCRTEQEQVDALIQQSAAKGNQVATQQMGGAPAPQLAETTDPVGNTDPAIPANEFVTPQQGAQDVWSPLLPEDALDVIMMHYEGDLEPVRDLIEEMEEDMKYYLLWCPWGEKGRKNAKWNFKYKPINSSWVGNWAP